MAGRCLTSTTIVLATVGAVGCASSTHGPVPVVGPVSAPSSDAPSSDAQRAASEPPSRSQVQEVPEYVRAVCGHPGAQVRLATVPITIPRDECDLTGAVVLYGPSGVTVPAEGGVTADYDAISGGSDVSANVDPITGDVTFS
jgi:hypothetical protein